MTSDTDDPVRLPAGQPGRPLIPKAEYIQQIHSALAGRYGYASAKMGCSEKQWLYYPILLSQKVDARRQRAYEAALAFHFEVQLGLFPANPEFYARYLEVYSARLRELDCLGLFLDTPELEREIVRYHRAPARLIYYKNQEPDRSSPGDENNCYLPLFAGKRLLLVASHAHFLRQRANAEMFTCVWAKTGKPWFRPASVDSVEFAYGYDPKTRQDYGNALHWLDSIQRQIARKDFDIALIAAGGLGIPLAGFVKSLGRMGLSLGGHLQIIFGVYGARWIVRQNWQTRYFNEYWTRIPPEYRPGANPLPDDGAYW